MGTKEKILTLFEKQKGIYLSGEHIAETLSVSRTAVWKAVKSLRNDGYNIDAIPNKGYSLAPETDILSAQGIQKYLKPVCTGLQIEVIPITQSTNSVAREKAVQNAPEGYVIISGAQTRGRGRNGRSFFSPADTGVYMSLVLRPPRCAANQAVKLTTLAAVAVCEAIEAVSGRNAQIKWVNDIFVDGRKVCGILTEASFSLEEGLLEYAILGIGVNVMTPVGGFPIALKEIAGSVFPKPENDGKNRLAAEILNHFMKMYTSLPCPDYVTQYRNRSCVIGKRILVRFPNETRQAIAQDIDESCHLIVRYANGTVQSLSSGEISIVPYESQPHKQN